MPLNSDLIEQKELIEDIRANFFGRALMWRIKQRRFKYAIVFNNAVNITY